MSFLIKQAQAQEELQLLALLWAPCFERINPLSETCFRNVNVTLRVVSHSGRCHHAIMPSL